MKKIILVISTLILTICNYAQNVGINTTGAVPDASALLDVDAAPSNDKGLLIPRVALLATNNPLPINAPAVSLLVYNTDTAGISPNNVIPGFYYWDGTKWVAISSGQNASVLDIVELVYDLPSGANGGASVANAWTTRGINTELNDFNNICTLTSDQFTLPAGTYDIQFIQVFFSEGNVSTQFHSRIRNITSGTTALIASTTTFELQYYAENAWNRGLGYGVSGFSGENERYVYIRIKRIAP